MLELIDVTKKYKKVNAVTEFNMFIERGELIGLLGPNGAGKSTAISMLSTLIEPTKGDVLFQNKSVLKNPSPLRRILGIVPQEIALYQDLTAYENLQFFGRIYGLDGQELRNSIDEILEIIGLTERRKEVVKTFSGGMKRRLNIGVSLLHDPELLIMDEPTVGIDPQSRNYILETVKHLNEEKKMTVIYTSHYMEEIEFLCDRIYIMDQGNLIASGTKDEIKQILTSEKTVLVKADRMTDEFIADLRKDPSIHRAVVKDDIITIIVPKEVNIFQKILSHAENNKIELYAIETKAPSLEDVFLHLTGRALRD